MKDHEKTKAQLVHEITELRRHAEEQLRAKTAELYPPRIVEETLRLDKIKWWLDGEGQL